MTSFSRPIALVFAQVKWRLYHYLILLVLIWCVISIFLALQEWPGHWHVIGRLPVEAFKTWLFWSSWCAPLLALYAWFLWFHAHQWWLRIFYFFLLLALCIAVWARCIEPQIITVRSTTLHSIAKGSSPLRIALVSDLHVGLYFRQWHLNRLVEKLNELPVDAVMFAGDWSYEPELDLVKTFAPLAKIKHQKWGVLGNHDLQKPGPALQEPLRHALSLHGVQLLEGKSLTWKGWKLVGLDDLWGGQPEQQIPNLLHSYPSGVTPPVIVLTHQPDTVEKFPPNSAFLTLTGHTHGGQIQLPWLTRYNLETFARNPWYDGLYQLEAAHLLVSTGMGETGLPARFLIPPRIELISLEP